MSLFKRQKSAGVPCPRCSQLVPDDSGDVCPMCGWDVREAYQGPATAAQADESAADSHVA
jgi:RNA polymerase subunit RPABC4/transcription elongation factor Spt4